MMARHPIEISRVNTNDNPYLPFLAFINEITFYENKNHIL